MALTACSTDPINADPDVAMDATTGPGFADLGGLRDGTVVRFDQGVEPVSDGALFTEAGVCQQGATYGVACTPEGTPLIGATVAAATRDCAGEPTIIEVETGPRGFFELTGLAAGPAEVSIQTGNFFGRFEVNIAAGGRVPVTLGVSDKVCLESNAAKLAVLSGDYDSIQDVLAGLGFEYDLYCGDRGSNRAARQLLADWDRLSEYQILFVNCGPGIGLRDDHPDVAVIAENLRRFVAQGGSIYASDLAADFVGYLWPDHIEFGYVPRAPAEVEACCVCTDCAPECIAESRPAGRCPDPTTQPASCQTNGSVNGSGQRGTVRARVPSAFLRNYVPENVTIEFNLGGWVEIESVTGDVEVLVEADRPLMVLFEPEPGGGRVAYTSFHNHAQANETMRQILSALVLRL